MAKAREAHAIVQSSEALAGARCVLEMGRFVVGEDGYFVTRVVTLKQSRGIAFGVLDGGMNNHLAACGLMGMSLRRNYPLAKLSGDLAAAPTEYNLVGPLCTTIDTVAQGARLPKLDRGDLVVIGASGAYGLTSSPMHFISHPVPREIIVAEAGGGSMIDASEH
jgi:diaminopimelate decarboxylase